MKPLRLLLPLAVYLCALSSCVTKKDLVYFQNASQSIEYQVASRPIKLRTGDVLNVVISTLPTSQLNTFSNADVQNNAVPIINGYTISEQGTIQLPVIGEVAAAGKTLDQVRARIIALVAEYFQNASVKVHLLSFTVSVLGEVAQPGQYTVYKENITFLDGLALGGDLLPSADRNRVHLIRTEGGATTRHAIDLQQDSLFSAPYFYLQPDDVIYVEPARYRSVNPLQPWAITVSALSVVVLFLNIILN